MWIRKPAVIFYFLFFIFFVFFFFFFFLTTIMLARASCVRMSAPHRGLQCLPVSLSRAHRCTQVTRASNSSSSAPDDGQAASQKDELRQVIAEATPAPAEATQEDFSRFLKVVSSQSWEDVEAGVRSLAKQNALTEGVKQ